MPSSSPRKKAAPSLPENVRAQLGQLGLLVQEVSGHYVARLRREVAEIILTLKKKEAGPGLNKVEERRLRHLLDLVARLQIDPQRGRRKDLKKLDALIGEFQGCLEKR